MNYCTHCGSVRLEYAVPVGDIHTRIKCADCQTIHYQNPKIVAGCLVIEGNKVLLCQRDIEPRKGCWNLPAGFMENKETLKEAAMREVREEANATVTNLQLHTIYNILHVNQVYFIFLAEFDHPDFSVGEETAAVKLFDLEDIPWDNLAFESNKFVLQNYINNRAYKGIHHGDSKDYTGHIKS
jgi:ADP-ribose pyrophosphatase YjhB (NUDIX family)